MQKKTQTPPPINSLNNQHHTKQTCKVQDEVHLHSPLPLHHTISGEITLNPSIFNFRLVTQVNANYVYDYSQKQKTGLVVRPFDLPKINLAALTKPRYVIKQIPPLLTHDPLKPSGDLCSCKTTVVSPALVPKPAVTGMGLRYDTTSKVGSD